ncbi:flagellar basal body P-ring formation chaperone FlgA [Paraferrimonas sedimenticola]|uniref:Flagella basal body P-ring formation protein FlgA n=1 Tax=Paraferrimonas sedimenticola TaxID=375674 RepID=A0AA37RU51_9GAMM|nr:flagellar basal body P-ring formation chaperone FlgA [Paraferrimonas sedimenticola]GLP94997.1 flagella basal body P-ring formation protein FlgA [Paraferrimonas sedimenticola]
MAASDNDNRLSALEAFAKDFVEQKLDLSQGAIADVKVLPIDPRSQLVDCPLGYQAKLPANRQISRHNTLKVECREADQANDGDWHLYVKVRVNTLYPAIIVTKPLVAGHILTKDDLKLGYLAEHKLRGGTFQNIDELIGVRLKRRLNQDQPVFSQSLCYVCQGDQVTIIAAASTLQLRTRGQSVSDGNIGDTVRVKNSRSGKLVEAVVRKVGEVQVRL